MSMLWIATVCACTCIHTCVHEKRMAIILTVEPLYMQGTHWACRVLLASFPVPFFSRTGRRAGTGDEARVLCPLERDSLLGGDK